MMTAETKAPRTVSGLLCHHSGFDMVAPLGECQQGDSITQPQSGSAADPGSSGGLNGSDRRGGSNLRQDFNNNGSSHQQREISGSSDEARRQAEIITAEAQAPVQTPAACETSALQGASTACCLQEASPPPPPPPPPQQQQKQQQGQILMSPPALLILPPPLVLLLAPPPLPPATAAAPAAPAQETVQAHKQMRGNHLHPLGCMFDPELDKAGVLAVVSQVLCRPGYTSGPSEEKRLLRSVGSGRVDIRTMARLLRWLRGERAARELRDRGLRFIGPSTEAVLRPITTGLGMTHLTKEVAACGYQAGTQFVVCFSSNYDACSGVISGVLAAAAAAAHEPGSECDSKSESVSESAPTSSGDGGRCGGGGRHSGQTSVASTLSPHPGQGAAWTAPTPPSSFCSSPPNPHPGALGASGKKRTAGPPAGASAMPSARAPSATSVKGITITNGSGGGDGGGSGPARGSGRRIPHTSRRKRTSSRSSRASRSGGGGVGGSTNSKGRDYSRNDVVAHLFDERPTHSRGGNGIGGGSGGAGGEAAAGRGGEGDDGGCVDASGGGGVSEMEVGEWAKLYGECDGPLLAAWVFPGGDASSLAE